MSQSSNNALLKQIFVRFAVDRLLFSLRPALLVVLLGALSCGSDDTTEGDFDSCARIKVLGGTPCSFESPSVLRLSIASATEQRTCSAVAVGNDHLLTAAHCLIDSLGLPTVHLPNNRTLPVRSAEVYPPYLEERHPGNDLAVLKLPGGALRAETISPLPIALGLPEVGATFVTAGYGIGQENRPSTRPRTAVMEVVQVDDSGIFSAAPISGRAGGSTCPGDSGGPAIFEPTTGFFVLSGIVSEGLESSECEDGSGTIFTAFQSPDLRGFLLSRISDKNFVELP